VQELIEYSGVLVMPLLAVCCSRRRESAHLLQPALQSPQSGSRVGAIWMTLEELRGWRRSCDLRSTACPDVLSFGPSNQAEEDRTLLVRQKSGKHRASWAIVHLGRARSHRYRRSPGSTAASLRCVFSWGPARCRAQAASGLPPVRDASWAALRRTHRRRWWGVASLAGLLAGMPAWGKSAGIDADAVQDALWHAEDGV